jgi:hypothetical protein
VPVLLEIKMFIVLTRDVFHPESQEYIYPYATILPISVLTELHKHLGMDEFLGHFCMTIDAAEKIRADLLAEFEPQ